MGRGRAIVFLVFCAAAAVVTLAATFLFALQCLLVSARGGATALTLQLVTAEGAAEAKVDGVQQAATDIHRAVGKWGWGLPRVSVIDPDAGLIRLELAVPDSPEFRSLLEESHQLVFKLVERELETREQVGEQVAPDGMEVACTAPGETPTCYLLNSNPVIDSHDIKSARPTKGQSGENALIVTFTEPAAERLSGFSAAHKGRLLAIVLDGVVVMAPVLNERIPGDAMIHGRFSEEEVRDLAFDLRSGSLPPLRVVGGESISPTPWLRPLQAGLVVSLFALLASLAGIGFFAIRLRKNRRSQA